MKNIEEKNLVTHSLQTSVSDPDHHAIKKCLLDPDPDLGGKKDYR